MFVAGITDAVLMIAVHLVAPRLMLSHLTITPIPDRNHQAGVKTKQVPALVTPFAMTPKTPAALAARKLVRVTLL